MGYIPPLKPFPMKERSSMIFLEYGELDVIDGAFVLIDIKGVRVQIPVGSIACVMLEPGTRVSHAAVTLAARSGTLLVWVGEAGVRLYSSGHPGGARSERLLYQAALALDPLSRLKIVRKMFSLRFAEDIPDTVTINQLRGLEGLRVRELYYHFAEETGINWHGRNYDPRNWEKSDFPNRCLSSATACLYGVVEAGILAAGYSPSIGFLHTGKPLSFVYDIADIFKFETVVPAAFAVAAKKPLHPEQAVRRTCRDFFRSHKILERIIPTIQEILDSGDKDIPKPYDDMVPPAFED